MMRKIPPSKLAWLLLALPLIFTIQMGQGSAKEGGPSPQALGNASYLIQGELVTFKNGKFQRGKPYNADTGFMDPNWLYAELDKAILGDLNRDGNLDAAVIYYYNTGGSGCFVVLGAVVNIHGKPVNVASEELGDRVIIKHITIRNGIITIDMMTHGPQDGMANPTQIKTVKYKLIDGKLFKI